MKRELITFYKIIGSLILRHFYENAQQIFYILLNLWSLKIGRGPRSFFSLIFDSFSFVIIASLKSLHQYFSALNKHQWHIHLIGENPLYTPVSLKGWWSTPWKLTVIKNFLHFISFLWFHPHDEKPLYAPEWDRSAKQRLNSFHS